MVNLEFSSFEESCLLNTGKKTITYLADKTRFFHPDEITVNKKYGTISDRFVGEDGPLVIHIKEGHFNQDSFVATVNLIEELLSTYGINLLLKESSSMDDTRNRFERYCYSDEQKNEEIEKDIADHSYWTHKYLYIMSKYPLDCRGVDNRQLRDLNYLIFGSFDPLRPAARRYLEELKEQIEALKRHYYPKELQKFETMKQKLKNSSITLNEWVQFLKKSGKKLSKNLKTRFPNLFHFLNSIAMEGRMIFIDMDDECESVLSTPNNTTEFSLINTEALFDEIEDFGQEVQRRMIKTKDQKILKEMAERVDLLLSFLHVSLVPREYHYYTSHRETFDMEAWRPFLNEKLMEIGSQELTPPPPGYQKEVFSKLDEFYDTCIRRAYHFVDRAIMHIEHSRSNAGILITGGFHTVTITRLLKQKKVSYVVITPQIKSPSDDTAKDKSLRRSAKEMLEE